MANQITERDIKAILDLYKFRYLSVSQIHQLHFPSQQTAYRRLRALKGLEYLKSFTVPNMGLFGKKRDYLFITNEALKDHRMYMGARDYSNNLDVSLYVTTEPGFFKGALSKALSEPDKSLSFMLDLFVRQELIE